MSASESVRTDEAGMMKPKNSRTAGTGSVIDPTSCKYPSTHTFASSKESNESLVNAGAASRRPGGSMRKGHTFGCSCGEHPCKCGTKEAKSHIIHENIQE